MEEHESEEQMQEGGRGRSRGNSAMEVNSEPLIQLEDVKRCFPNTSYQMTPEEITKMDDFYQKFLFN